MADASGNGAVTYKDMYEVVERVRIETTESIDRSTERMLTEVRRIVDDKNSEHERLEARIEAERIARQNEVATEREARHQLQIRVVTIMAIATGVITTLMLLLNLFGPLIRDALHIPA